MKKATEEEIEQGKSQFHAKQEVCPNQRTGSMVPSRTGTMRRAGTIIKSPRDGRQRDQEKQSDGDQRASEVNVF